ncbi:MAG: hypothetical protein HY901_06720 [Deltaproteobacteria bacterium]|nr:hypothetical protein [Deltaproteobacteria bacterium]
MKGPAFFPEALDEYEDAVVYYESCEEGLGTRLACEVDEAIALVMELPEAAPEVANVPPQLGLRSVLLQSFPYKLVYVTRDETLLIVAIFHIRRRPGFWTRRLKRR